MKTSLVRIFAPGADSVMTSLGLLVLRVWLGLTMLLNHGWGKLSHFGDTSAKFPDLFGIGPTPTAGLAVFGEVVCAALLVVGLLTRFAALGLAITMGVAFSMAHGFALSGQRSGETAFIFLAGFVALLLAGPGRFSVDAGLFRKG